MCVFFCFLGVFLGVFFWGCFFWFLGFLLVLGLFLFFGFFVGFGGVFFHWEMERKTRLGLESMAEAKPFYSILRRRTGMKLGGLLCFTFFSTFCCYFSRVS